MLRYIAIVRTFATYSWTKNLCDINRNAMLASFVFEMTKMRAADITFQRKRATEMRISKTAGVSVVALVMATTGLLMDAA